MNKLDEFIVLYNKGISLREIAKLTNSRYDIVRYHLVKNGIHKPNLKHVNSNNEVLCLHCKQNKNILEFERYETCGYRICKICEKEKLLKHDLKKLGCSVEEYQKLHLEQDGQCKICLTRVGHVSKNGKEARLAVDHCHKTGKIRGLLCGKCNMGLGLLEDKLEQALDYLNKYR